MNYARKVRKLRANRGYWQRRFIRTGDAVAERMLVITSLSLSRMVGY